MNNLTAILESNLHCYVVSDINNGILYWFDKKWNRKMNASHNFILNKLFDAINLYCQKLDYLQSVVVLMDENNLGIVLDKITDNSFEEKLDTNEFLIGFENGVYDLKKSIFRPAVYNDYVSVSVGYDYEEYSLDNHHLKNVLDFLVKLQPDEQMRDYLLKVFASFLDGDIKHECFYGFIGSNCGKSTLFELCKEAFGEHFGVIALDGEMDVLKGKKMIVMNDTDTKYIGMIKSICGDDWMYSRVGHKFKNKAKLLFASNVIPDFGCDDYGIWRRSRFIPFMKEFVDEPKSENQEKKDIRLSEKVQLWKKVFMWYLINAYYPIYKNGGLHIPIEIKEFTLNSMKLKEKKNTELPKENPKFCPVCGINLGNLLTMCDNVSCGTITCQNGHEFFFDEHGGGIGHRPSCDMKVGFEDEKN